MNKKVENYLNLINDNKKGMTIKEIVDGVKSGKIKIDYKHHNEISIKKGFQEKHFTEELEKYFAHCEQAVERLPNNMFTQERLNGIIEEGDPRLLFDCKVYCWECDAQLSPVLIDNTLYFFPWYNYFDISEKNGQKYDYLLKKEDIEDCIFHKMGITDKMVTEIDVPSGKLVFQNFFRNKEIYDSHNINEEGINSLLGRYKLMQYLASKNVGYGQMGNMSINIYRKFDGKEIIISNDGYRYDEENGERWVTMDGYKDMGEISLDVWRWQCADMETLKKFNEEIEEDAIIIDVKPGRWVIEHHFDIQPDDDIYSKIYLK